MQIRNDVSFYAPLWLVANPFVPHAEEDLGLGSALEITAAVNRLLGCIVQASATERSQVIVVDKSTDIPSYYHLRAIGHLESMLINDERLNLLHAYIPLFTLRRGRIRSTLGVIAERLAFRSFDQTIAALVERILAEPDPELPSFDAVKGEVLDSFAARFTSDPIATVRRYFGEAELERRPELAEVVDIRLAGLDNDVVEDEGALEVDATVGDAPGTGVALPAEGADEQDEARELVVTHLLDYVARHLSPVIARGLRMYRERGLAALSAELKVTRAPRKTLRAVVDLATANFSKVVVIYDGFENWAAIEPETKAKIVGAFKEMVELLGDRAIFCFLLERGVADEIRSTFPDSTVVPWDFANLERLQSGDVALDTGVVTDWLEASAVPGSTPLTLDDGVLAELVRRSDSDLNRFIAMASAAIEDAAERGCASLDDAALAVALSAGDAVSEAK